MELEIKHLAPYLPYDLKVTFEADEHEHTLVGLVNWSDEIMVLSPFNDYGRSNIKNCKPILRPLSDLTKEIMVNGEDFVPYEYCVFVEAMLVNEYLEYLCEAKSDLSEDRLLPYSIVQLLFEWRFDVFGLIEKGLAVNINSVSI